MKSISAEDKNGGALAYDKKTVGILFVIALLLALANSFYIMQPNILDTDPSTYAVVPLIMLPVVAIFTLKSKISPEVDRNDIKIGIAAFSLFLILNIALRINLSYEFLSYRIDMLILTIALVSFIVLLFGSKNLRRFKFLLAYALLSSPILFMPVITQNQNFAVANTIVIYNIAKVIIPSLRYDSAITISAYGNNVSIGQACVGIGALIGLALFLLPLVYFYNGKLKNKAVWIATGLFAFLLLNLLRMLAIALYWFSNGANNTILAIHVFAGIMVFYACIVLMVLLAGKYRLSLPQLKNEAGKPTGKYSAHGAVLAIAFAIAYLALSSNYSNSLYLSPVYLGTRVQLNLSNRYVQSVAGSLVGINNSSRSVRLAKNGSSAAIVLYNKTISSSNPIIVFFTRENITSKPIFSGNNSISSRYYFMNGDGTTGTVYLTWASGTQLYVYHSVVPYPVQDRPFFEFGTYIIIPAYALTKKASCGGSYDFAYTSLANIPNPDAYNIAFTRNAYFAYCLARAILK